MPDIASERLGALTRPQRLTTARRRRWRPRWTLRLRLTLLYGSLFLVAGTVLLAITYGLVAHDTAVSTNSVFIKRPAGQVALPAASKLPQLLLRNPPAKGALVLQARDYAGQLTATVRRITQTQKAQLLAVQQKANAGIKHDRQVQLDALLTKSAFALGLMALISIGLGWLMAGRALRPVRTMASRARGISERNLHERLALAGPNDELKELGDTFDGLLARLETAFESQRRFVANASHELRTPITLERTLVEVALADPDASTESLRETCRRVLAAGEQQERLIEALLTLACSQRGIDVHEELDLGAITGEVVRGVSSNGIRFSSELGEACTTGDPALVERMVINLVDNAIQYNEPHGWVQAWTGTSDGHPTLRISNPGPAIPPDRVGDLLEPFRRLDSERTGHPRGLGLGLSIVGAIATAHGAELVAAPRRGGGLDVEVRFPVT